MREIKSAAMVINAKSRKGQKLFKRACAAMKGLPYQVDARAIEDPEQLEAAVRDVLSAKPDLVILGGGDGTISGLVDLLVGHGLVTMEANPHHQRAKLIVLTPAGREALTGAEQAVVPLDAAILDRVGSDRLAVAIAVLREMNDAMSDYFASRSAATTPIRQEDFA